MGEKSLNCWCCGRELEDVPLPLSRYAECPGCRSELYVCRMCRFYDPGVAQACREPMADEVKEKTRANFCDYMEPSPAAWQPDASNPNADAERRLQELFGSGTSDSAGDSDAAPADPLSALESLFGDGKPHE